MWKKGTDIALRYGVLLMYLQHYTVLVSVGLVFSFNFVFVQVNPELKNHFEDKGFRFVGQDIEGERMEVIELDGMEAEAFFKVKNFNPYAYFYYISNICFRPSIFRRRAVSP